MPVLARNASESQPNLNQLPVQFLKLNGTSIEDCTKIQIKVNLNAIKKNPNRPDSKTAEQIKNEIREMHGVRVYGYKLGKNDLALNNKLIAKSQVVIPWVNNEHEKADTKPEKAEALGCLPEEYSQPPIVTGERVCSLTEFNQYNPKMNARIAFDIDLPTLKLQQKHAGFSITLQLADEATRKDLKVNRLFVEVPESFKFHTSIR